MGRPIQLPNSEGKGSRPARPITKASSRRDSRPRRKPRMASRAAATLDSERDSMPIATSKTKPRRETDESMATRQKDIAVTEFFAKNRHLLGFDNPRKALLTTAKEAVDNSLDACEEAGILPN